MPRFVAILKSAKKITLACCQGVAGAIIFLALLAFLIAAIPFSALQDRRA